VRRDEIHAFIERHRHHEPAVDVDDVDHDLADWGLLPRRGTR
jgi:hypothetical protein